MILMLPSSSSYIHFAHVALHLPVRSRRASTTSIGGLACIVRFSGAPNGNGERKEQDRSARDILENAGLDVVPPTPCKRPDLAAEKVCVSCL